MKRSLSACQLHKVSKCLCPKLESTAYTLNYPSLLPLATHKPQGALKLSAAAVTSVVSDSVRPHRRQPTTLPRPWDSPGKNTGVGCHFLLQGMKVKSESEVAPSLGRSLRPHGLQPTRLLCPWDFPGKSLKPNHKGH